MAPQQKIECDLGHNNWYVNPKTGNRHCRDCLNIKKRERVARDRKNRMAAPSRSWSQSSRLGDRGPREDTFSIGEIMRARGYD